MSAINLLPAERVLRHRRASRLAVWGVVVGAWAALLMAAYGWLCVAWPGPSSMLAAELVSQREHAAELVRLRAQLQRESSELESARQATLAIRDLPDWSVLLRLLPTRAGGRVVFTSCTLAPEPSASSRKAGRVSSFVLVLQGLVPDPRAATDLTVDLERLGVFDRVSLVETQRSGDGEDQRLSFRIECVVNDAGAAKP